MDPKADNTRAERTSLPRLDQLPEIDDNLLQAVLNRCEDG